MMTTHDDDAPGHGGSADLDGLLRRLRERALLTQEELAHRSGLSIRTIRGLESGRIRRPRSGSVRLLAEALGLAGAERETLISAARGARAAPVLGVRPAQLPADVSRFTGRAGQLRRLDALVDAVSEARAAVVISAIDGTAGVGKPIPRQRYNWRDLPGYRIRRASLGSGTVRAAGPWGRWRACRCSCESGACRRPRVLRGGRCLQRGSGGVKHDNPCPG